MFLPNILLPSPPAIELVIRMSVASPYAQQCATVLSHPLRVTPAHLLHIAKLLSALLLLYCVELYTRSLPPSFVRTTRTIVCRCSRTYSCDLCRISSRTLFFILAAVGQHRGSHNPHALLPSHFLSRRRDSTGEANIHMPRRPTCGAMQHSGATICKTPSRVQRCASGAGGCR